MLVRNLTSCLLLHIVLNSCSISARSCLIEILRIFCFLAWNRLRRTSHIKVVMRPIVQKLLLLCMPADHGLRMQLEDNVLTFTTQSNLHVACNSPLLLSNGSSYVTLQLNIRCVKLNRISLPESIWVRIFTYYMPKKVTLGALECNVHLVKVSKRTMQFRLCGDVSKWVGGEPLNAYVRFTPTTLELFAIPNTLS